MTAKGNWQDYRGKSEGVLVHVDTTRKHELPVRDVLNEYGRGAQLDPHYETSTYNLMSCVNSKLCSATIKNKRRYLLFGTRYQGTREELRSRFLIIGYMRIDRNLEVRKRHVHQWMENPNLGIEPECINEEECYAFGSDDMRFYAPEDAFELSEATMQEWGYKGKITKQMKLTFVDDKLQAILGHLQGRTERSADYIAAISELLQAKEASEAAAAQQDKSMEW